MKLKMDKWSTFPTLVAFELSFKARQQQQSRHGPFGLHPLCDCYPRLFNLALIILFTAHRPVRARTVQLASPAMDTPTNPRLRPLIRWERVAVFAEEHQGLADGRKHNSSWPRSSPRCSRGRNTSTLHRGRWNNKKARRWGEKVLGSSMITL